MAGNILAYARQGWQSITSIISHWAPASENDTGAYIRDVAHRLGLAANAQLNLNDPGTLAALMGAIIHHEQGYDPYAANAILNAARTRLGVSSAGGGTTGPVTISQKTDIHVHGSDAPGTARAVASAQSRVNGDMVRYLVGALDTSPAVQGA